MLKGNLMSCNPLARDRWRCSPGCFAVCNARALHGPNPHHNPSASAVRVKPPLQNQIRRHQSQRGGVRQLEERARANGQTLSEWVRDVLLSAPAEPGAEANEIVLAEVLALRTLFLNLQFRAGGRVR